MNKSSTWLERFHNAEIEIHYSVQQYKDRGRLVDSGDDWLELLKQNGETLLIPFTAIRVLKVIELEGSEENTLLRASALNESPESIVETVDA